LKAERIRFQDWGYVSLREIDFLLKNVLIDSTSSSSWRQVTWVLQGQQLDVNAGLLSNTETCYQTGTCITRTSLKKQVNQTNPGNPTSS